MTLPADWLPGVVLAQAQAADVPADDGWLAPAEQAVLATRHLAKRRADWRLGRWTAKQALRAFLGPAAPDALARLAVLAAPDGAPEAYVDGLPLPVTLSLSHRDGHALAAVAPAGTAVGCDVERAEPRSAAFVADYFTSAEQAFITTTPEPTPGLWATLLWSAKESALKALREGLRLDTRSVEVTLDLTRPAADGWPLTVRHTPSGQTFTGWAAHTDGQLATVLRSPPEASHPPRYS